VKTLVLGIGNDILGDDGVGIHIAREAARRINAADVTVEETGAGGLSFTGTCPGLRAADYWPMQS